MYDGPTYTIHRTHLLHYSGLAREKFVKDEQKVFHFSQFSAEMFDVFYRWIYDEVDIIIEEKDAEDSDEESHEEFAGAQGSDIADSHNGVDRSHFETERTTPNNEEDSDTSNFATAVENPPEYFEKPRDWPAKHSRIVVKEADRIAIRLINLCTLATKLQVPALENDIILQWQRYLYSHMHMPGRAVIDHALDKLGLGSNFVRYLVLCYANYHAYGARRDQAMIQHLPRGFLNAVYLIEPRSNAVAALTEAWCTYHNHIDEEDRQKCQADRPNDADVKA